MKTNVLIVDDEQSVRAQCAETLKLMGFETETADSGTQALQILEGGLTDIVLSDIRMPGMGGIELLKTIKQTYSEIDVVMMTGFGTIAGSVEAIKMGAFDYVTKPFVIEDFKQVFLRLVKKQDLAKENQLLREQLKARRGYAGMVGTSARMQKIFQMILKAAPKRHPVLILGESGTGKELVARAIHAHSPWKDKPFVSVDCSTLTSTLIESELFGHVRGAFTGADHERKGLLASAQGGTILLDEFAELPIELQTKLLHALQEHEIRLIGGNFWTHLEGRIIAATNQNILAAIQRGSLRKDLFYRLNVLTINVPPLRERKSDIPALAHDFIDRHGGSEGRMTVISGDAMNRMMNYNWPGNIRELENCIQRALVLGSGQVIEAKDLPSPLLYDGQGEGIEHLALKSVERRAIMEALQACGGCARASKVLGIGKTTIYRKIKEYGLENFRGLARTA